MLGPVVKFIDQLEPVDFVRCTAILGYFLYAVFVQKSRDAWFTFEQRMFYAVGAITLLFPDILMDVIVDGSPDPLHFHLMHITGAGFICLAGLNGFGERERGENTNIIRLVAGFLCSSAALTTQMYGYMKYAGQPNHFTLQFLLMPIFVVGLWWVGSIILLLREGKTTAYNNMEDGSRQLINHQLIDFVTLCLIFASNFGCPTMFSQGVILEGVKMDGVHVTAIRGLGWICLYALIMAVGALFFQSEDPAFHAEQVRDAFFSKMLYAGVAAVIMIFYQYKYHMFDTSIILYNYSFLGVLAGNSYLGFKEAEKQINS